MKRSDMLLCIREDIYTYSNCPEEEIGFLAEKILKNMEDYGMLPPDSYVRIFEVFGDDDYEIIPKWEPEYE